MNRLLILLAIIAICSCSKKNEIPKGILGKEKMAMILVDIYESEAKVTAMRVSKDSAAVLFRHYELMIFDKHGITEEKYFESYKFYLDNPDILESTYDIVIDSLGVRERLLTN